MSLQLQTTIKKSLQLAISYECDFLQRNLKWEHDQWPVNTLYLLNIHVQQYHTDIPECLISQ